MISYTIRALTFLLLAILSNACTTVSRVKDTSDVLSADKAIVLMKITGPSGYIVLSGNQFEAIYNAPLAQIGRNVTLKSGDNYLALEVAKGKRVFISQYYMGSQFANFNGGALSIGPLENGLTYIGDAVVSSPTIKDGRRVVEVRIADNEALTLFELKNLYPQLFKSNAYKKLLAEIVK